MGQAFHKMVLKADLTSEECNMLKYSAGADFKRYILKCLRAKSLQGTYNIFFIISLKKILLSTLGVKLNEL